MARGSAFNVAPSAARTTSGQTALLSSMDRANLRVQLNATVVTGTTPTLDVVIEDTVDGGTTWNTIGTFTQLTAAGRQVINVTSPFTDSVRARWTIGGTTPSFTFAVDAYLE